MKPIENPAPETVVDPNGQPRFGTYRGCVLDSRLTRLADAFDRDGFDRWLAEKKWHYTFVSGPKWFAGLGIFQSGYLANGFAFLFDRDQKLFRVDETAYGLPWISSQDASRPDEGASTRFRAPGFRASILKPPGTGIYRVHVRTHGHRPAYDMAVEMDCRQAAPGMSAICPLSGSGSVNLTVKQVGIPARGRVVLDEEQIDLTEGHLACLDYTHGLLANNTNWMWACGSGLTTDQQSLGFNLAVGINGSMENAIWINSMLFSVETVHFERSTTSDLAPWHVRDEAGRLDLTFQPEGNRSLRRELGPFSVHHMQPVGTFTGFVKPIGNKKISFDGLPGVVEEHSARW